jgi:hypothetical protein
LIGKKKWKRWYAWGILVWIGVVGAWGEGKMER